MLETAWNYECWWAAQVSIYHIAFISLYNWQFRYSWVTAPIYLFVCLSVQIQTLLLQNLLKGSSLSNRTTYNIRCRLKGSERLKGNHQLYSLYTLIDFVTELCSTKYIGAKERTKSVAFARLPAKAKGCEGLLPAAASCPGTKICNETQTGFLSSDKVSPKLAQQKKMYVLRISTCEIISVRPVSNALLTSLLRNISTWRVCTVEVNANLQTVLIYGHHLLSSPLATSAISPKANKALSSIAENTLPSSVPPWQFG